MRNTSWGLAVLGVTAALLLPAVAGATTTVVFGTIPDGQYSSVSVSGITVTGSALVDKSSSGLGIVGGVADNLVDSGGESMTVTFDDAAQDIVFLSSSTLFELNPGTGFNELNSMITAFGPGGTPLGSQSTTSGLQDISVSALFGGATIESFTLSMNFGSRNFAQMFYTPVPEPGTAALFALGLAALGVGTRQRVDSA